MLSKNNSNPAICVNNLIQIARGEVPYDRVKGISTESFDVPISQAADEIVEDAEWMLDTYEPRAEIENIEAVPNHSSNCHFDLKVTINPNKEADNE